MYKRILALVLAVCLAITLVGCNSAGIKLDPKNPVTINIWHYYNGAILNIFDALVEEFNDTVGLQKGIIVEATSMGNVAELEKAVSSAANKEVGSLPMPNVFASYADTAYEAEKLQLLANLGDYFTAEEQSEYIASFIEEGRIGLNGELRIFPIAKSTEIFMLNDTDWAPFAADCNLSYDDLSTAEGLAHVAKLYYEWTDAQTPDIQNDGKAFYGRDYAANFMIISSKEFGVEIFKVENGKAAIQVDREVMRRIWDYFYIPYISGYYYSYGRFRSDDARVGDVLSYVGSTASASYFPTEITIDSETHNAKAKVLQVPGFTGGANVLVQQGAGMVVTKTTPEEEYASVEFLKWFTESENNIGFAAATGYLPVKKDAMDYDAVKASVAARGIELNAITDETLRVAIEDVKTSELYTNKAFTGGAAARTILERSLQDLCVAGRETVLSLMLPGGAYSREEAIAYLNTEENFSAWVDKLTTDLLLAANGQ